VSVDAKTKAKADKKRQQDKERQRAKRQRDQDKNAALGVQEYRVQLSQKESNALDILCAYRGGAIAYDANEYIATLIRRDKARMEEEKKHLGNCDFCGEPLPMGCKNGLGIPKLKGVAECWYTRKEKKLRL
jgi:hypothetical protein